MGYSKDNKHWTTRTAARFADTVKHPIVESDKMFNIVIFNNRSNYVTHYVLYSKEDMYMSVDQCDDIPTVEFLCDRFGNIIKWYSNKDSVTFDMWHIIDSLIDGSKND